METKKVGYEVDLKTILLFSRKHVRGYLGMSVHGCYIRLH